MSQIVLTKDGMVKFPATMAAAKESIAIGWVLVEDEQPDQVEDERSEIDMTAGARQLIEESSINPNDIPADGKLTKRDVQDYLNGNS